MFYLKLLCPAIILLCILRSNNSGDERLDIMHEGNSSSDGTDEFGACY